jgi:hypothetical protein
MGEEARRRGLNRVLLCRSWDIEGVTGVAGAAGLGREGRPFSGTLGHNMTGFAQDPFKGLAFTFRTLHFHSVVGLRHNLLKKIAALKTPKLKDRHNRNSKNTYFRDNNGKI